jgi:hypothetical protein
MTTINRHDVISSGSIALAVSNLLPSKRHLCLILAAAILSLPGTISAQAKQHAWVEEKEDGSHYAAYFRMPVANSRKTQSAKPAPDCRQVPVRGCVPDDFDTIVEVYFFNLPLTHGGPR